MIRKDGLYAETFDRCEVISDRDNARKPEGKIEILANEDFVTILVNGDNERCAVFLSPENARLFSEVIAMAMQNRKNEMYLMNFKERLCNVKEES